MNLSENDPICELAYITKLRLQLATANRRLARAERVMRRLSSAVLAAASIGFMSGLMSAVIIIHLAI